MIGPGQQLGHLPAPGEDVPRPLQGRRQHPRNVRDLQIQQAAHRHQQQVSKEIKYYSLQNVYLRSCGAESRAIAKHLLLIGLLHIQGCGGCFT